MRIEQMAFGGLLDAIAAKSPTPGGGAVAAMTLATAAALAEMVVNYSVGKKALASHDSLHQRALRDLRSIRAQAMERAEQDASAYAALNEVLRLKNDDEKRRRDLPDAVSKAIEPPLEILRLGGETLALLHELGGKTNAMLDSDLAIAAILANAAAQSAAWNVRINLPLMNDPDDAEQLKQQVAQQLEKASRFAGRIEQDCRSNP